MVSVMSGVASVASPFRNSSADAAYSAVKLMSPESKDVKHDVAEPARLLVRDRVAERAERTGRRPGRGSGSRRSPAPRCDVGPVRHGGGVARPESSLSPQAAAVNERAEQRHRGKGSAGVHAGSSGVMIDRLSRRAPSGRGEPGEPAPSTPRHAGAASSTDGVALDPVEHQFDEQRQQRHRHRTREEVVVSPPPEGQAFEDERAEVLVAHEGAERSGRRDLHRGGADPGEGQRRGDRQLDGPQPLPRRHAHPPCRVEDVGIDVADADVRVGEGGRDAEHHQRQQRRPDGEAAVEPDEHRERQCEHGEGGDGAERVGGGDGHPAPAPTAPGEDHRDRHGEHDGRNGGQRRDPQVGGGAVDQPPASPPRLTAPEEVEEVRERVHPGFGPHRFSPRPGDGPGAPTASAPARARRRPPRTRRRAAPTAWRRG